MVDHSYLVLWSSYATRKDICSLLKLLYSTIDLLAAEYLKLLKSLIKQHSYLYFVSYDRRFKQFYIKFFLVILNIKFLLSLCILNFVLTVHSFFCILWPLLREFCLKISPAGRTQIQIEHPLLLHTP